MERARFMKRGFCSQSIKMCVKLLSAMFRIESTTLNLLNHSSTTHFCHTTLQMSANQVYAVKCCVML